MRVSVNLVSLTKDGLPKVLGQLIPKIRLGDLDSIRLSLTILSMGRLIPGTGIPDLTPITSPYKGTLDFSRITKHVKTLINIFGIDLKDSEWKTPHLSVKTGPLGQALVSSMKDIIVMPTALFNSLLVFGNDKFSKYFNSMSELSEVFIFPDALNDLISRKISVLKDKEYKSRIICIFDYWSQTVLKPLHDSLMRNLCKFPADLTFNQSSFTKMIKFLSSGIFVSLDLKNATDRFPAKLQEEILAFLIGKVKAKAWYEIMVATKVNCQGVQAFYNAGQPMGAYSSWSLFTLCHHIVIHVAAIESGFKPGSFEQYVVLGDDVVIGNRGVSAKYKEIMSEIGVEISPTKSHMSKDTFEIAKRWFHKGSEVTPYALNALLECKECIEMIPITLIRAAAKGWLNLLYDRARWIDSVNSLLSIFGYSKRSREYLSSYLYKVYLILLLKEWPTESDDFYYMLRLLLHECGQDVPDGHSELSMKAELLMDKFKEVKIEDTRVKLYIVQGTFHHNLQKEEVIKTSMIGDEAQLPHYRSLIKSHPLFECYRQNVDELYQLEGALIGLEDYSLKELLDLGSDITIIDLEKTNSSSREKIILMNTIRVIKKIIKYLSKK